MTKGCKIWLWFILVCNILVLFLNVVSGVDLYGIFTSGIAVIGIALLLFKQNKKGFYLLLAVAIANFIVNAISGNNIFIAIILSAISPGITYYFLRENETVIR